MNNLELGSLHLETAGVVSEEIRYFVGLFISYNGT